MPKAVSKRQARFFRAVASGKVKAGGLSRSKAEEMVAGQKTRNLPESAQRFHKAVAKKRGKR